VEWEDTPPPQQTILAFFIGFFPKPRPPPPPPPFKTNNGLPLQKVINYSTNPQVVSRPVLFLRWFCVTLVGQ